MPPPATAVPDWATNATHPAGAQTWNGSATKVDPGAGAYASGFTPDQRPSAEWINYLFNLYSEWIQYFDGFFSSSDNFQYPSNQLRTVILPVWKGRPRTSDEWIDDSPGAVKSDIDGGALLFDLSDVVPSGVAGFAIDAIVTPGSTLTTRGGAGNGIRLRAYSYSPDFATPASDTAGTLEDSAEQADSTAIQVLTANFPGTLSKSTKGIWCELLAGSDGATNVDFLTGIRIRYTDPGPRNF